MNAAGPPCRFCGRTLSALQRQRGDHCTEAACRHAAQQARQQRLDSGAGRRTLEEATARLGRAPAALLWLRECPTRQVPISARRADAHRAFLQSLAETAGAATAPALPEPPAAVGPAGPQEVRLCAQCRGRCCNEGGATHAFITLPQLRRWQRREAGRTLQDAVDFFMTALPPRHTQHSCLYHGPQGCGLAREDRAEICNSHACNSLQQMRGVLSEQPAAAFAVVTLDEERVLRRAAIAAEGTVPLPRS